MNFVKQGVTAILCAMLVIACSGGGGGSAPTTTAPVPSTLAKIDTNNAAPVARGVFDAVFASGSLGDVVGGGSGGLVGTTNGGLLKADGSQSRGLVSYFASVPIPETTTPCAAGGSVTVSGEVADPTTLSTGDRITLQLSDCDDGAGNVLNGTSEFVVNSFSGDLVQGLVHLNATVTFDGFEVTDGQEVTSLNGSATLDYDSTAPPVTSSSLSGTSITVSDNSDAVTLTAFRTDVTHDAGVSPEAYTLAASGTLSSTLFDGDVSYSTPVPFMGFAGEFPFAGELLVTGADGASVRLVALDNVNIRLEIDPGDGSGIVIRDSTWTHLASAVSVAGTGVTGQAIMGPIVPGPEFEGQVNEAPFSASFSVRDSDNNEVARFDSDQNGNFTITLAPGDYTIVPDASAPLVNPELQAQLITVPTDGFADVILRFDTGIR